jgi:hypothetical protein
MNLNEKYSRTPVSKNLSDMFPIQNGLKEIEALSPLLFNSLYSVPLEGFSKPG